MVSSVGGFSLQSDVTPYKPRVLAKLDSNLYSVQLPDSTSDTDPGVALIYSSKSLAAPTAETLGSVVPTSGITYLNVGSSQNSEFFAVAGDNLRLVAQGSTLDLYVLLDDGTADKYSFTQGYGSGESTSVNAIDFSAVEIAAKRDLDGNSTVSGSTARIGGNIEAEGNLDTIGGLFRVESLGQSIFVVSPGLEKSKTIDISKTALRNADGSAWVPDESFSTFKTVFQKGSANTDDQWHVYATTDDKVTTKFTFSVDKTTKKITIDDDASSELTALDLAKDEFTFKRDLDGNAIFGVSITSKVKDESGKTALWKASLGDVDYLLIGDNLSAGDGSTKSPNSLSVVLFGSDGEAWANPDGYAITAVVANKTGNTINGYSVYLVEGEGPDQEDWDKNNVLRFDFAKNNGGNFDLIEDDEFGFDGVEMTAFDLAAAEKAAYRETRSRRRPIDRRST
jgi:hypothetical protein